MVERLLFLMYFSKSKKRENQSAGLVKKKGKREQCGINASLYNLLSRKPHAFRQGMNANIY